jgi:hypothetical protein
MKILFIHGANSTHLSFSYIAAVLSNQNFTDGVEFIFYDYDSNMPLAGTIIDAQRQVGIFEPDAIVGHSLGGVIAYSLETDAKIIAIASPLGGVITGNFFFKGILCDLASRGRIIKNLKNKTFNPDKHTVMVAKGSRGEGFDGILLEDTQTALVGPEYFYYDVNHFEILLANQVAEEIASRLKIER